MIEELRKAQAEVERLRALLTAQKAETVPKWAEAKKTAQRPAQDVYNHMILEIDRALLQKNWIELKWEAEGR